MATGLSVLNLNYKADKILLLVRRVEGAATQKAGCHYRGDPVNWIEEHILRDGPDVFLVLVTDHVFPFHIFQLP